MVQQSIAIMITQGNPNALLEIKYDYKLLMQLVRAPKNTKLYRDARELKFKVDHQMPMNLELELRRLVIENYTNRVY